MRTMAMLLGVLMATGAVAQGQTESPRRNVVALDVGGLLQSTIGVSAERAMTDRMSVRVGLRSGLSASWVNWDEPRPGDAVVVSGDWRSRTASVALEPGARFFLHGAAPLGLWVGPQLGLGLGWVRQYNESRDGERQYESRQRFVSLSASALAGYSAALSSRLRVQAAAGMQLGFQRHSSDDPQLSFSMVRGTQWNLQPVTQLSLGYAF